MPKRHSWEKPIVIVGEMTSRPGVRAFSDSPSRNRLLQLLQVDDEEFTRRYDRVNLCEGVWTDWQARASVSALVSLAAPGTTFILCGRKVQKAFGEALRKCDGKKLTAGWLACYVEPQQTFTFVSIPHPSGRCRAWNDPEKVKEAQSFLKGVLR